MMLLRKDKERMQGMYIKSNRTSNMRGHWKHIFFFIFAMVVVTFSMLSGKVAKAASANVYFEADKQTVTVGEEISIYLCVDAEATLGDFEGFISYNADILEFTSGTSNITGGDGVLKVYDFGTSSTYTRKYILNFKVLDIGYAKFDMTGDPVAYEYETGDAMSVSSKGFGITAEAPVTASENAKLATLKIVPGTLTPSFDPAVLVYNTIVDANTSNLVVAAIPEDLTASVSIQGNQELSPGSNEVIVEVTAESGKINKYVITVMKEELSNENEEELEDNEDSGWRFKATSEGGVIQLAGQYFFTISDENEDITIPDGYSKSSFVLDGHTIPAYQLDGNTESDYLLLILKNESGETGLYRYDRVEKTIQRYSNEQIIISNTSDDRKEIAELIASVDEYQKDLNQMGIIIALLSGLSGILLIGFIRFYLKSKGMQDDDLD